MRDTASLGRQFQGLPSYPGLFVLGHWWFSFLLIWPHTHLWDSSSESHALCLLGPALLYPFQLIGSFILTPGPTSTHLLVTYSALPPSDSLPLFPIITRDGLLRLTDLLLSWPASWDRCFGARWKHPASRPSSSQDAMQCQHHCWPLSAHGADVVDPRDPRDLMAGTE